MDDGPLHALRLVAQALSNRNHTARRVAVGRANDPQTVTAAYRSDADDALAEGDVAADALPAGADAGRHGAADADFGVADDVAAAAGGDDRAAKDRDIAARGAIATADAGGILAAACGDRASVDDDIAAVDAVAAADARSVAVDRRIERAASGDRQGPVLGNANTRIAGVEAPDGVGSLEDDRRAAEARKTRPLAATVVHAFDCRVRERHHCAVGDGELDSYEEVARQDVAALDLRVPRERREVDLLAGGDVAGGAFREVMQVAGDGDGSAGSAVRARADLVVAVLPGCRGDKAGEVGIDGDAAAVGMIAAADAGTAVAALRGDPAVLDEDVAAVDVVSAADARAASAARLERARALDRQRLARRHEDAGVLLVVAMDVVVLAHEDDRRVAEARETGPLPAVEVRAFDSRVVERHRRAGGDGDLGSAACAPQGHAVGDRQIFVREHGEVARLQDLHRSRFAARSFFADELGYAGGDGDGAARAVFALADGIRGEVASHGGDAVDFRGDGDRAAGAGARADARAVGAAPGVDLAARD